MAFNLIDELEALVEAFDREGIEYAICGALALGYHGVVRATDDIDVLVSPAQLADAIRVARSVGFDVPARKMTFGLKAGVPRDIQRVSKIDSANGNLLTLDLLVVAPDLEEVWKTRIHIEPVPSKRLVVVSRDGLATMKKIAGRDQDLIDLRNLERAGASDDEER
jgi:hypothetical protein